MSSRVTPEISATPGSTSRGTATSTTSSGRPSRRAITGSRSPCSRGRRATPVEVSSTSTSASASARSASGIGAAADPRGELVGRAPAVRLATTTSATPARGQRDGHALAHSPAPSTRTRAPSSAPSRSAAIATAADDTDTVCRPMRGLGAGPLADLERVAEQQASSEPVALPSRRRLSHASRTWPRISLSPRTPSRARRRPRRGARPRRRRST